MAKKKNKTPKIEKTVVTTEVNSEQITKEFSSRWSQQAYSNYYFGCDILKWFKPEQLAELIRDPMGNDEILRNISMMLYNTNGTVTNTIDYLTAMPTLDKVIITHGKDKKRCQRNKELMEAVLRGIKDKVIIRDMLFRGMIEGVAFYYLETTEAKQSQKLRKSYNDFDIDRITEINELGVKASIISLPTDYTRIVGRVNNIYVLSFNLDYFTESGDEPVEKKLKKFPKEIRDAYRSRKVKTGKNNWVVLDSNRTIVHKIRSKASEPYGRPLVLAAISDILYSDYFTATKRNMLDELNNKVIYETFPEGKEKGTSALTKQQQEQQHNTVKNAVMNKNKRGGTSFFSVAAGTKMDVLKVGNTDIFDEKYEKNLDDKIALAMGIAGSLLNGSGSGTYSSQALNVELISAQLYQWIEQIEFELNKVISNCIIKDKKNWCEVYYLRMTHVNRKQTVGFMKDLYTQAGGSMTAYIAASGFDPNAYFALLDQEYEQGIYDKYEPHQTSYTLSNKQVGAGRPQTDNPSDRTVASQNNGGNNLPSPSDN